MRCEARLALSIAVLAALSGPAVRSQDNKPILRITNASPQAVVLGRVGHVLICGQNLNSKAPLSAKLGDVSASSVTLISDTLLCAEFPMPAPGPGPEPIPIAAASLVVSGGGDTTILPNEIVILPPPGGDSLGHDYISQVTEFARGQLISGGTGLLMGMNRAKKSSEISALAAQMTRLTTHITECTRQQLLPSTAAGFGAEVQRAVDEVDAVARSFNAPTEIFAAEGNQGPDFHVVHRGDSIDFQFVTQNATLFVDFGRGPVAIPFSGTRTLRITALHDGLATVRVTDRDLRTPAVVADETSIPALRAFDVAPAEGTLNLITGEFAMTYNIGFQLFPGGTDSFGFVFSTHGVVGPIRHVRKALAQPNNPLVIADKRYNSLEFASGDLPFRMPDSMGGRPYFIDWHLDKLLRFPRPPRIR